MASKKFPRQPLSSKGSSSQPLISSFGNSGVLFNKDIQSDDLHPQVVKMARKSGQLNLSNKGLVKIPLKVFHLNEMEPSESKKVTVDMNADDGDDKWWEHSELKRLLYDHVIFIPFWLSDNRLTTLPPEIKGLKFLNKLILSRNDLQELPKQLCQLEDLKVLMIDHNNLKKLPEDIGSLCVLEQLDVSHNALENIPPSVGYLQRLNKLAVTDNVLNCLPVELGDLFGLVHFDLARNKLTKLPDALGNLPKLENLCLRQNQLTALPPLKCPNLKELYVGANKIKSIDEASLEALSGLHVLDISENGIEDIPDNITLLQELRRFDLSGNYISSLPYHMGFLPHLKAMPLDGNPLRQLRRDIVQRGTTSLLKYLASKTTESPNTFPGFLNYVPEVQLQPEKSVPDQYEMRNMRAMVYNNAKLDNIPDELFENGRAAQVRTADLSQNRLTTIPPKLEVLSGHLCELVVSQNCLETLPQFLSKFHHLQFIDVRNNKLSSLPEGLELLKELREINISFNKFVIIPDVVYKITNLEILFASDNKITKIEAEKMLTLERLATLDLRNNDIDYVPPLLGKMTQLRSIQLEGNAFRVPRYDILAKGSSFLLNYLKSRIVES
ncbi:Leucine-rich repeat-containing protein 40 [Armadillidium vulgare]|nr:Leucine-rich repeat-containing protein 40 [Armadillidium vulgare]